MSYGSSTDMTPEEKNLCDKVMDNILNNCSDAKIPPKISLIALWKCTASLAFAMNHTPQQFEKSWVNVFVRYQSLFEEKNKGGGCQ